MGIEIWGRQLTKRGGSNWGPKKGSFWLLKMSQNRGYPQRYISTPAWRSEPPFHMQSTGSPTETHMFLALKDLHGPGVVMIQTGSTNAKMAKSAISGDRPG